MKCPNCHQHIKAGSHFCLHCGYPLRNVPVRHHSKLYYCSIGLIIIILLIISGVIIKQYFTPAQSLSRQLPKYTLIESNTFKGNKNKHNKLKPKTHYSYIISNGSELLSFGKNKKSTNIFNLLSENSQQGKQLRNNISQNMKNVILQSHYTYNVKGNNLYFNSGNSFRSIKKYKNGFMFKFYKGKKFLHTERITIYRTLSQPIK